MSIIAKLKAIIDPTTTRGDLIRRGATGLERVAAVTNNRVVRGDGTDVVLGQIDATGFFTDGAAADGSNRGIVTTGTQTFAGAKTFSTSINSPAITLSSSPSRIYVNTYSSRVNTNVIVWTNSTDTAGSDITYDSANGTFTINTTGLYFFSATAESSSALALGITVNNTSSPGTLTYGPSNALLAYTNGAASVPTSCSGMAWLTATNVIRVVVNNVALVAGGRNGFHLIKIL